MLMFCWCSMQFVVFCGEYKLHHCTIFFYLFLKIDFTLLYEAEWCSNDTLRLMFRKCLPGMLAGSSAIVTEIFHGFSRSRRVLE